PAPSKQPCPRGSTRPRWPRGGRPRRRMPMPREPKNPGAKADGAGAGELLVELGSEEIPAGFLARALAELQSAVPAALAGAGVAHGPVSIVGTPRRIAIAVAGLAGRQQDVTERVVGPPVQAAYDKSGAPTKAALGFAEKNRVDVGSLEKSEVA